MLRVVAAEVVSVTEADRFSARADFREGLGIIRAENSMGKTTLLMSILYAMGLEGMLGPGDQMPLKPAVLTEIRDDDGQAHAVIESWAIVEIAGGTGRHLTLQRPIVSTSEDRRLVHSWAGPALTEPSGTYAARDYYVRMGRAAQSDAGLHRELAEFIGWDLPEVATWHGSSQLYMEVLFSLLFVEQTRGWAGIAAVMPRYLKIRDPERRAIEFLTGLQELTRARDREALAAELADLKADWRAATEGFRARISELGVVVDGLPRDPPASWPPSVAVSVRVVQDDNWAPLGDALSALRAQLAELAGDVPRVEELADQAVAQLHEAEARVARLSAVLAAAAHDVSAQQTEFAELHERLAALDEDRARYADAIRLTDLGSVQQLAEDGTRCPTCDQRLPSTLLGDQLRPVMTLQENKSLLDEERRTFTAMRDDAESVASASRKRLLGLRRELDDARSDVRSLKATLVQHAQAPSRAIIERQVRLAQRIDQLERLELSLVGLDEQLEPLATRHQELRAELAVRRAGLSQGDDARLNALEYSVREQLGQYGFESLPPDEVSIDRDSYLPSRSGRALRGKDISASDNVRLVWAYLIALMELARDFATPHPGFIAFDEPGQQDISDDSLRALFGRLASTAATGQQALVATSKPKHELTALLAGQPAARNDYTGHVLRRR